MSESVFDNIPNQVKLVIWDLDETFWTGTLSEGGMTPVQANIDMVKELADRGIMSSICSKNEFDPVKTELENLGIWQYFIFAHIDWTSKGQALKTMIAAMGLRDENVLFIDDNAMNLQEARFFNPNIMCLDGAADFSGLLDNVQLRGKPDPKHMRLKQYKSLETKQADQGAGDLSNEEFLRQSGIKLQFVFDLEKNWDRVLELVNRTNQLNFTKIRAETDDEVSALKKLLLSPSTHAGLIDVSDRYGDYGIVGFYLVVRPSSGPKMIHFAFSCRTLHMGIEQFVWNRLGKPDFAHVGPTASKLDSEGQFDWITEVEDLALNPSGKSDQKLCLVGGCDLLQMSFYTGGRCDEYVNIMRDNKIIRFDDAGFFLNDRKDRRFDMYQSRTGFWTRQDMLDFDKSLAQADVVVLSLFLVVTGEHFYRFGDGQGFDRKFLVHMPNQALRETLKERMGVWFTKNFFYVDLSLAEKIDLTQQCYEHALKLMKPEAKLVMISASEEGEVAQVKLAERQALNALHNEIREKHPNAVHLDLDEILAKEDFFDSSHYTRTGYYKMAQFVNRLNEGQPESEPKPKKPVPAVPKAKPITKAKAKAKPDPKPTPAIKKIRNKQGPAMRKMFNRLFATDPYIDAPLDDVAVDLQGWASNHFLFRTLVDVLRPTMIVEVGTWKGMSAIEMAKAAKSKGIEGLEICCIDTWLGSPGVWNSKDTVADIMKLKNGWPMLYFTFMKNVIDQGHQDVITPMPMPSDMGHVVLKRNKVMADLIYIDAAHDYENCKRDIERYWEILSEDGIMLGDDYDKNHPGVIQAAKEFAKETGAHLLSTPNKFVLTRSAAHRDRVIEEIRIVDERRALAASKRAAAEAKPS